MFFKVLLATRDSLFEFGLLETHEFAHFIQIFEKYCEKYQISKRSKNRILWELSIRWHLMFCNRNEILDSLEHNKVPPRPLKTYINEYVLPIFGKEKDFKEEKTIWKRRHYFDTSTFDGEKIRSLLKSVGFEYRHLTLTFFRKHVLTSGIPTFGDVLEYFGMCFIVEKLGKSIRELPFHSITTCTGYFCMVFVFWMAKRISKRSRPL